jgi:hypothetical protein
MDSGVPGSSLAIKSSVSSSACCATADAAANLADAAVSAGMLLVSAGLCCSCACLSREDGSQAAVAAVAAAFSAAASLRMRSAMKMHGADMSMYIKNLRSISLQEGNAQVVTAMSNELVR